MKKQNISSTHELLERLANLDNLISRAKRGYQDSMPIFDMFLYEKNLMLLLDEREAIKLRIQKKVA